MKSYILLFTLTTIASAVLGACSNNPVLSVDTLPIMPLKIGNRWIGQTQRFDSAGKILQTTLDTLEIVAEDVLDGETWYVSNRGIYYANRTDGLWYRPYGRTLNAEILAKHPAVVGDVFGKDSLPMAFDPDSVLVLSYRVRSVNEEVKVLAGTFRATRYVSDIHNLDGTPYELTVSDIGFTPGVGMVEELNYGSTLAQTRYIWKKWELIEVVLKQ